MNTFYHGDCLLVMRHDITPGTIDLIYLDPPFFTGKIQKGEWRPEAMEISFEDSRQFWKEKGISTHAPHWLKHIAVQRPDFASYLHYLMERLQACHRVLKNTGSIYLHCDWRASHYLKMVMDDKEVFGSENFRNEIIWKRDSAGKGAKKTSHQWSRESDSILFYTKSGQYTFRQPCLQTLTPTQLREYIYKEPNGRKYKKVTLGDYSQTSIDRMRSEGLIHVTSSGREYKKYYLDEAKFAIGTIWTDIVNLSKGQHEKVGYPTQKPEQLLTRIIEASSSEGDLILDPFCGCGTTVIAASQLNRQWIGIDIDTSPREPHKLPTAFQVISNRSHSLFEQARYVTRDLSEVEEMDGNTFEAWTNEFYKATKPKPDRGVDGITQDGIPIQAKVFLIKYNVLSQFITDAKLHPSVPKPVKEVIIVSQTGFDDGARKRQFEIETTEGVKVRLETPQEMLRLESP